MHLLEKENQVFDSEAAYAPLKPQTEMVCSSMVYSVSNQLPPVQSELQSQIASMEYTTSQVKGLSLQIIRCQPLMLKSEGFLR